MGIGRTLLHLKGAAGHPAACARSCGSAGWLWNREWRTPGIPLAFPCEPSLCRRVYSFDAWDMRCSNTRPMSGRMKKGDINHVRRAYCQYGAETPQASMNSALVAQALVCEHADGLQIRNVCRKPL